MDSAVNLPRSKISAMAGWRNAMAKSQANAGATFEYGRPMKGHSWHPDGNDTLVKMMTAQMGSQP